MERKSNQKQCNWGIYVSVLFAFVLIIMQACSDVSEYESELFSGVSFDYFTYEGNDPVFDEYQPEENEFLNPIISGFYPDPSIIRDGEDYFMVHSSFASYPGIPLFHSKDLVSWTQIGYVLDRPSQLDLDGLGMSRGIYAPTINYHDGVFYVLSTNVDGGGNFMVTSEDPMSPGSWSEPIWLPAVQAIDPSIFFDDDGRIYILNNGPAPDEPLYEGHRAIWIQEYFPDTQTTGPDTVIIDGGVDITQEPIWVEAPHLKKINGEYILTAAEGGTGPDHSQVVFKADHPMGPYTPWEINPILTQRDLDPDRPNPVANTGHADFVQTQNGEWWAVFLGVRPYEAGHFNTGRETFMLPVTWTDDNWPMILDQGKAVPYVHERPDLPIQPDPEVPIRGNYTYTDHFDQPELAPHWSMIRTPREIWYRIDTDNDALIIRPRNEHIGSLQQPSFLGHRQKNTYATASTAMRYTPGKVGDAAGMVAYQNDNYYYFFGIVYDDETGGARIQLEKEAGDISDGEPVVLASEPISYDEGEPVYLKIEAKANYYDFHFSTDNEHWETFYENADGTVLSTDRAGGFTGAFLGLYAYEN